MDLDLVILGTAASVPSPGRGLSSMLIRRGGHRLLIDCGEGTQRQLMRSVGLSDIDAVFITHTHADHVLGLPGMLKTFGLRERTEPLLICGPENLFRFWQDIQPLIGRLPFDVEVVPMTEGVAWACDGAVIEAVPTEHGVPSLGWHFLEHDRPGRFDVERARELAVPEGAAFGRLQQGHTVTLDDGTQIKPHDVLGPPRLGRSVVYSGDTVGCARIRDAARDASVLIHEATFLDCDSARAMDTNHSTASDAAMTAAAANVEMLLLTHISTRYRVRDIIAEADAVFENTIVARDFDIVEIPLPERGGPIHHIRGAREKLVKA